MAIKQRNKIDASFSMSSMTDIIFLLLLFFMIASTMSSPNDMKVNLPQSKAKTATKANIIKVGIDRDGAFSIAEGVEAPQYIDFERLEPMLKAAQAADSTVYVALHADEEVPYKQVVRVLDIANQNKMKLVIATKVAEK